jgi:hypothetical protein
MSPSPYCRLFGEDAGPPPEASALAELAAAMCRDAAPARGWDDSRIPAAYTYFGQLIAHDLSFERTRGLPAGFVQPGDIANERTGQLSLDSIYGEGPAGRDRLLYEEDGVRLRLGPIATAGGAVPGDLPRDGNGRALIADERNDETLAIAQTQVLLMNFHNRVADHLDRSRGGGRTSFAEVRAVVVRHVQSVVLHDLLWRLVPDEVYHDVLRTGRRLFHPGGVERGRPLMLPVEFTHAAFRFGHSMVRSTYRWNRTIAFASLASLLDNTARNGPAAFARIHPDWLIDWRNFLDFSAIAGASAGKDINYARKIDTLLTEVLHALPAGERGHGEPASLAVRDLLRGRALRLPSGQEAARECERRFGIYVGRLGEGDFPRIRDPLVRALLQRHGFDQRTPLWVYVLAEAEIEQEGERLGRLGGRIVMEVLHAAIEASEPSIFAPAGFEMHLPRHRPDAFTLPDLVAFSGLAPSITTESVWPHSPADATVSAWGVP